MKKLSLLNLKTRHIVMMGFFIYLAVISFNDGFMAFDEYYVGISRYIPAQTSSISSLVGPDDVKSPLQLMPMHAVAQAALWLGVNSPYWQYRLVIFVLGLINIFLFYFALEDLSRFRNFSEYEKKILYLLGIFYFALPFALTRPMFESLAAPWLLLAAVQALRYDRFEKLKNLLWGVFFGSVAFVLRQQIGFCALIFIILPLLKKRWKDLLAASALGLVFFIISGIPDYFIRGQFHFSLLQITLYNYKHGAEYGHQSILFYPLLILVVSFFPFFIARYPKSFLRNNLKRDRSLWIILGLFVFLHSLFPQKWERFVISVLPVIALVAYPYLSYLQSHFAKYKIRLVSLYSVNFFLFVLASFFPAQENLIAMSRYLDVNPKIHKVYRVANTPEWITEAFITNKQFEFVDADLQSLAAVNWQDCQNSLVVGEAQAEEYRAVTDHLKAVAEFNVNLIEQLAFKLNPAKNPRRVQLKLYTGCQ